MRALQAVFTARHETSRSADELLADVRACRACEAHLPLGARPVLQAVVAARILGVGRPRARGCTRAGFHGTTEVAPDCVHGWTSMPSISTIRPVWRSCRWVCAIRGEDPAATWRHGGSARRGGTND